MPRSAVARASPTGRPERIDFHRTKYGPEILIDVAWVREMPTFLRQRPHWLSFYDILLVTRGNGWFALDGQRYRVRPGAVFFTTPGQVREWRVSALDGLCLFFPAAFLEEFFNDADFLHRLPYFHAPSAACGITMNAGRSDGMRRRLASMRAEVLAYRPDSPHLLRAKLYEELVNLAREYARVHDTGSSRTPSRVVLEYRGRVNDAATPRHTVAAYARDLAVSAGHLNRLCRRHLGLSAKEVIQERIEVTARRLLLYSGESAAQIAKRLGFRDPSYFTRFFRRRTGVTPARFREKAR